LGQPDVLESLPKKKVYSMCQSYLFVNIEIGFQCLPRPNLKHAYAPLGHTSEAAELVVAVKIGA